MNYSPNSPLQPPFEGTYAKHGGVTTAHACTHVQYMNSVTSSAKHRCSLLHTSTQKHTLHKHTHYAHMLYQNCVSDAVPNTITQMRSGSMCCEKDEGEREIHGESLWRMTSPDVRSVGGAKS